MTTPKLDRLVQTTCKPDCTHKSKHTVQIWDTNYKQWVHNAQKATEMVPNTLTALQLTCHPMTTPKLDRLVQTTCTPDCTHKSKHTVQIWDTNYKQWVHNAQKATEMVPNTLTALQLTCHPMTTPKLDRLVQTTCTPDCTHKSKHTVQIWDTNYKQWVHNAQKATEMVPNTLTALQLTCHPMTTPKLDRLVQTTCKPDCTHKSKHTVQIWDTNYKQWVHNAQKATEMVPNTLTAIQLTCHPMTTPKLDRLVQTTCTPDCTHKSKHTLQFWDTNYKQWVHNAQKATEMVPNPLTALQLTCHPMTTPKLDRLVQTTSKPDCTHKSKHTLRFWDTNYKQWVHNAQKATEMVYRTNLSINC